jgi:hypothetical protein
MTTLATRLSRLRDERGFTLAYVMLFMLVGSLFAISAWSAANGDIRQTKTDEKSKLAYAAAESGLNYYIFKLNQDNGFWTDCAGPATLPNGEVNPVNPRWDGTGTDPRRFRAMPGGNGASYAIEPLPVGPPPAQCVPGSGAEASMLNALGEMTIRSTGKVGNTKRTVVATLNRAGFLDFLYFTDYETIDPLVWKVKDPNGKGSAVCNVYRRDGRSSLCDNIVFAGADFVNGPMHTNDDMLVCGSPTFGRNSSDDIELSDPAGWKPGGCGGAAAPIFKGTYTKGAPTLDMPVANSSIKSVAQGQYIYKGQTRIKLTNSSSTMEVTNAAAGLNAATVPLPSNGVIYVDDNGTCGQYYDIVQDYDAPASCGHAIVEGKYAKSLTIAAKQDIIIKGNVERTGNAVLGLIADNFVRIYHPVLPKTRTSQACTGNNMNATGTNAAPWGTPSPTNMRVDAAILALNHSFIVDNYYCGASLGTLTINGAIAQSFRGPVGTTGGTGYLKSYNYDDRLRKVNPPFFLDPVNSAWRTMRFNEQIPAT